MSHVASMNSRRAMGRMYVALLGLTVAFGVLAAYQWERGKTAVTRADTLAGQNAALTQQVRGYESLARGLAAVASVAYADDPTALLAQLDELEAHTPDAAATEIFVRLWTDAKDRDAASGSPFETANGPAPTRVQPAPHVDLLPDPQVDPQVDSQVDPKAEPVVQDRAKGDALPTAAAPDTAIDTAVEIAIAAKQESWIQIVDAKGAPIFTKLMKPGDQHMLTPGVGATLITGNPTGLALSVDGVTAPAFSDKGPTRRQIALDPQRLLDGTAENK